MSSLTNLYVDNVIHRLPESSREDIAAEITATISDMIEDRLGDSSDSDEVKISEREVLEELGDPALLAAEYANSPQHFIGPKSYPLFLWALRWLLPIIGLLALLSNITIRVATTDQIQLGELLGGTIGGTVSALLIGFAVITILIGLGDRGLDGGAKSPRDLRKAPWNIDDLHRHDPRSNQVRTEAILGLVFLIALAAVPFIPTTLLYVGHLNGGETFINPDLGAGWLLGYWGFLALMATVVVIKLVTASAGRRILLVGALLDIAMAVFLTVALLTQQVLHPELTSTSGADVQQVITVIAIWIIVIWDQASTWRTSRRPQRG